MFYRILSTNATNTLNRLLRRNPGLGHPHGFNEIIFSQLSEKHFHPLSILRRLPNAVINDTGQL
jgi:hypothetical protein